MVHFPSDGSEPPELRLRSRAEVTLQLLTLLVIAGFVVAIVAGTLFGYLWAGITSASG